MGASDATNGNTTAFLSPDVAGGHDDTQKKLSLSTVKDEAEEDITHLREMIVTTSDEDKTISIRLKHCEEDVCRLRNKLESGSTRLDQLLSKAASTTSNVNSTTTSFI